MSRPRSKKELEEAGRRKVTAGLGNSLQSVSLLPL